jgi:hypothetical protein
VLLTLFAVRWHIRSPVRTATFWALVGFALYLNKGTMLVMPVMALIEVLLSWRTPTRLLAACAGFLLGAASEIATVVVQFGAGWGYMGWSTILAKESRNAEAFPRAFLNTIWFMSEYRIELLAIWILALGVGLTLLGRACLRLPVRRNGEAFAGALPVSLGLTLGVSCFHLVVLAMMAKEGLDAYVIYGYPTLVVTFAILVAVIHERLHARSSKRTAAVALIAATFVLYRPDALTWEAGHASALWRNQAGAVCSWRFAEGFEREVEYGLATSGQTRERHAIDRCRSLSEQDQVLDCIGGIARELQWRQPDGRVRGDPPAGLTAAERQAYAYLYGTHRKGDTTACSDFADPSLVATCVAAVELECLHYADTYTRMFSAEGLRRPRCPIVEPPMDGFWATRRLDLLTSTAGAAPNLERAWGDDDLTACDPVFRRCYEWPIEFPEKVR